MFILLFHDASITYFTARQAMTERVVALLCNSALSDNFQKKKKDLS